jgi:hypothetical protein
MVNGDIARRVGNNTVVLVLLLLVAVGALATLIVIAVRTNKHHDAHDCDRFRYEVPFVCGVNPRQISRIQPGTYATTVHVHNANDDEAATIQKKLTLSFPPSSQEGGFVSEFLTDSLQPCQTLKVSCAEMIPFGENPFDIPLQDPPYVMGVLVVRSDCSLTVWAEQTTDPNRELFVRADFEDAPVNATNRMRRDDNEPPALAVYRAEERCIKR